MKIVFTTDDIHKMTRDLSRAIEAWKKQAAPTYREKMEMQSYIDNTIRAVYPHEEPAHG